MSKRIESWIGALPQKPVWQLVLLAVVVLLGAGLRFYKLGQWGFWGDEIITINKALDIWGGGPTRLAPSMLGTHVVLQARGVNEGNGRVIAALFGILTIPVLYWLVKRVTDTYVALLTALLLAVAPWHIYWSQNARFYTALLLFYTLALFFFHLSLEKDSPLYMIVSLGFFGLAAWERLLAGFIVPTILAYLLLLWVGKYERPSGLNWRNLAIYFVPGLLGLIGIAALTPTFQEVGRAARTFGFVNNNPFWILSGVVFYVGVPLMIMAFAGAVLLWQRRDRLGLLLTVTAVVPLVSLMLISMVQYAANRYAFVSLTSLIVLAAVALRELLVQIPRQGRLLAVGVLLILIAMPMSDNMLYFQYQNGNRDDWKGALAFIERWQQDGDKVITANRELADYYLETETLGMQYFEQNGFRDMVDELDGRLWIMVDLTAPSKAPGIIQWTRANARFLAAYDVSISARTFPMQVYLYDPAKQTAVSP